MIPHHVYYQLAIVGLLWLCVMLHYLGPSLVTNGVSLLQTIRYIIDL